MKAIETRYSGCRFRSRTEARWAVFFNANGWTWQYEPEGFRLPSGGYLPDFLIEGEGLERRWFEVKPFLDVDKLDARWVELATRSETPVMTAYGMHRQGDGCGKAWKNGRTHPHAGRLTTPNGLSVMIGPFWTHESFSEAWNAASSARFEFGESG